MILTRGAGPTARAFTQAEKPLASAVLQEALEIELWRIGESSTAPKFNIISKPNDWTKPGARLRARFSSTPLSDLRKLQLEYWKELGELIRKNKGAIRPTKPLAQHWQTFAIGRYYFLLYATMNIRNARIGVQLVLQGSDAKAHYELLHRHKDIINGEAGERLDWRMLPDKKESQINYYRHSSDPSDRSLWKEQHQWLLDKLELFHRVFANRIKSLDASEVVELGPNSEVSI